ncbi:MAG: hypothetical protein LBE13_05570 [Bacteroidales bacterium]|nr:hypothetical protein [Bacteroidales bacterium]
MITSFNIGDLKIIVVKQGKRFYSRQYYLNKFISSQRINWWLDCNITELSLIDVAEDLSGNVKIVYNLQNNSDKNKIINMLFTLYLDRKGLINNVDDPSHPKNW